MIDLYTSPTPNGHKVSIALEEMGLDYEFQTIDLRSGEQKREPFLTHSPNGRIPAIYDRDFDLSIFESGAIMMHLAEKSGKFLPTDVVGRSRVVQWLMFQMGNVGPMFGQNGYFQGYCPEDVPLAKERYHNVCKQLYGVMDRRLGESEYLAGSNYSIADVATFPWTMPKQQEMHRIDITQYPNVKRWSETVAMRPAVQRGIAVMAEDMKVGNPTQETYNNMFGAKQFKQ